MANVPADSEHSSKGAECWSDLVFDLLLADELEHVRETEVRNHLLACDRCRTRFEGLKRFRDQAQLPVLDWTGRRPEGSPRGPWLALAAGTIAAAAAALLWVRSAPPTSSVPGDETRSKGAGRLGFYVKRGERVIRGGPGEILHPGDALEFSFAATRPGFVAVLSVDGAGKASVYYPTESRAKALPAGEHVFPQSTLLDGVLGREVLHGLFCDSAVELEPLRSALEQHPGSVPALPGCEVDSLEVEKRVP